MPKRVEDHSLLVSSLHSSPGGLHKELSNGAHGLTMEFVEVFKWEFPKIRGTLSWGPYNKDLLCRVL